MAIFIAEWHLNGLSKSDSRESQGAPGSNGQKGIYAKEPYKVPDMGGFGKHSPWSPGQTRQFKAWKSNHVFFFNPD